MTRGDIKDSDRIESLSRLTDEFPVVSRAESPNRDGRYGLSEIDLHPSREITSELTKVELGGRLKKPRSDRSLWEGIASNQFDSNCTLSPHSPDSGNRLVNVGFAMHS